MSGNGHFYINDADEPAANSVVLAAHQTRHYRRDFIEDVMGATNVGERRPPLLRPRGFRETTDRAGQLDPDRSIARPVFLGLDEPNRWIVQKLGQLSV